MVPVLVLAAVFPPPAPLLVKVFDLGHPVQAFAVSADGTHFAAARDGNQIDLHDVRSGKLRHGVRFNDGDRVRALAFSPDGKALAAGADSNAELRVWSAETGQTLFAVGDHPGGVCALAFAPDGKTIATAAGNGTLRLIDGATGALRTTIGWREAAGRTALAFDPTGRHLIAVAAGRPGLILDATTGRADRSLTGYTGPDAPVLAVSADGRTLLTARADRGFDVWEAATGRRRWMTRPEPVRAAAFSPDGLFAAVAFETRLEVRGVRLGEPREEVPLPPGCIACATGGGQLFTAGADVRVWWWPGRRMIRVGDGRLAECSTTELALVLEGDEVDRAHLAIGALARRPGDAVWQANRALKTVVRADPETAARVRALVGDLSHDDFRVRESATARLLRIAPDAPAEVLRAARDATHPEGASRLAEVVRRAKLTGLVATPAAVRWLELLELVNTRDARAVVSALAKGDPDAEMTRDAIETLKRMERRVTSASPATP